MAMPTREMYEYGVRTPLHCRDREETGCIRDGASVRIVGLSRRQDLNMAECVVQRYIAAKERWAVTHTETGESVLVRPSNLRVERVQPQHVPSADQWLKENAPQGGHPQLPPVLFASSAQEYENWKRALDSGHPSMRGVQGVIPPACT